MRISDYIAGKLAEAHKYFQDIKSLNSDASNAEAKERHGQHAAAGQFGAALGIAGIGAIMSSVPIDRIEDIRRLERIVNALESIGVNLDEEDIGALEGIAARVGSLPDYAIEKIREAVNDNTHEWLEESREREQEKAVEALTAAGFVLDDEDGETWTKDGVTVKIECVHPAESKYKWQYERGLPDGTWPDTELHSGVSGEFHRLLTLIGSGNENNASTGAETARTEAINGR